MATGESYAETTRRHTGQNTGMKSFRQGKLWTMNGTERNGTDNEGKEGGVSSRGPKRFPPEPPFQKLDVDCTGEMVSSGEGFPLPL